MAHPVPVKTEKEISFEHLGGKVVRHASEHPAFKTNAGAGPAIRAARDETEDDVGGVLI